MNLFRTLMRRISAIAGTTLLASAALTVPAAADTATGGGRTVAAVAWTVALIGAILGGLALARPAVGRRGALAAAATGLAGLVLGAVHFAGTTGGFGTGSGRAGALVAVVVGLVALVLSGLALTRLRRVR